MCYANRYQSTNALTLERIKTYFLYIHLFLHLLSLFSSWFIEAQITCIPCKQMSDKLTLKPVSVYRLKIAHWRLEFNQSEWNGLELKLSDRSNSNLQFSIFNPQCVVWQTRSCYLPYIYLFSYIYLLDLSRCKYVLCRARTDIRIRTHSHSEELRHVRAWTFLIDFNFVRTVYVPHCTPRKIILDNSSVRVTIGFGKFAP